MPPKNVTASLVANGITSLTAREHEIMAFAWQCFETEPKLDIVKLAGLAGFGNPRSASNAWSTIKKKLGFKAAAANNESTASTPVSTMKTNNKRGAAKAENDDVPVTPVKKARVSKDKERKIKDEVVDDTDVGIGAADPDQLNREDAVDAETDELAN